MSSEQKELPLYSDSESIRELERRAKANPGAPPGHRVPIPVVMPMPPQQRNTARVPSAEKEPKDSEKEPKDSDRKQ